MASNFRQFEAELDRELEEDFKGAIKQATQKIGLQALRSVVLKTPVDTGRARANWQTTIGTPADGQLEREDKREGGNVALVEGQQVIQGVQAFQQIWLTNNVDYIEVLEDGYSGQAPNGMISVTISELTSKFRRIE